MLLNTHELEIGEELHLSVKVDPGDAEINGKFEWRLSSEGIVTVREGGGTNEAAVLKAIKDGDVTLTVRYVDGNRDEGESVRLEDRKLALLVAKEETAPGLPLIIIFAAIVVVIIVVLIAIAVTGRRRRAEEERRERIARKQREEAKRERAQKEERDRLMTEGYEMGYRDSEVEQFERITRVYDAPAPPPPVPPAAQMNRPLVPPLSPLPPEDEEEKPFSVDDIE
jgi:uncharacterized membrane protein